MIKRTNAASNDNHSDTPPLLNSQVAEHCWDPVAHAIATYGYLFDRLIQARQREV
jgi:hypothetical protein